jgi:hypothetical protein
MHKNTFSKFNFILSTIAIVLIFFSLFFSLNKNIFAQEESILIQEHEEECLVDADIGNGFEMGKIPIGEAVDYAELYAREIIRNLNTLIVNTEKAANTAYSEKAEDDLYDLPPQVKCEKCEAGDNHYIKDNEGKCTIPCGCVCLECDCCPSCGEKCPSSKCVITGCSTKDTNKGKITSGICNSNCLCNGKICTSGSCTCIVDCTGSTGAIDSCGCGVSQDFHHCKYICTCSNVKPFCEPLTKFSSGVKIIQDVYYNKIVISNDNIAHLVDVEGEIMLCNCPLVDLGFITGKIEIPEQLNRWKIVNALTDSRNKLENCLIGYARVLESERTTATLLSCLVALDKITLAKLLVVPGFNKFGLKPEELCFEKLAPDSSDVCYPYNSKAFLTDEEVNMCKQNKDGNPCRELVKDLMWNFSCCIGGN